MKVWKIKFASVRLITFALSLGLGTFCSAGQIIDRLIANVNGHVVLQSDWEQEVNFEAFSNGRDPASFTESERKAALDRIIDQELLREQVRPSQPIAAQQVAASIAEIRKLHPDCTTEQAWTAKLERYGLSQSSLEKRLGEQIRLMKMVEDRLRPSIQIDQQAIESYYHDQLLPEVSRAGGQPAPLTQVSGKIKDLLAERKLNELLSGWLASLRSESHILIPEPTAGEQNR
jgi:peptidyl-prolyl cis-trans isomerase SurA